MTEDDYKGLRTTKVDKGPRRSLAAFVQIAGRWWFSVWVLVVLSGLFAFALTVANVTKVPAWVWGSLIVLGLLIAPAVAFHLLRIDRDTFKALWDDKEAVRSALTAIEDLRAEAAALQIKG